MLQEEGGPKRAKASSASRVYESQSAFLRLMKVRWGGSGRFIWKELPSWTMIDWKVVGTEGHEGSPLRIQGYVGSGYCDVG